MTIRRRLLTRATQTSTDPDGPWVPAYENAVVLSGGGSLGAAQTGMLQALFEAGVVPDLLVGVSVGSLNATVVAIEPTLERVLALQGLWRGLERSDIFGGTRRSQLTHLLRRHPHLFESDSLCRLIAQQTATITDLSDTDVDLWVATTDLHGGAVTWWSSGDPVPVLAASCCLPGVFPPVALDGSTHIDGGILAPVPVQRALDLGARNVWVLDVSTREQASDRPMTALDVVLMSFTVARAASQLPPMPLDPSQTVNQVVLGGTWDMRDFNRTDELIARGYALASRSIAVAHASEANAADLAALSAAANEHLSAHEPRWPRIRRTRPGVPLLRPPAR